MKKSTPALTRLKEERVKRGWSQERVAVEANVSKETVRNCEQERFIPRFQTAAGLARAFGLSVEELFPDLFKSA